MKSAGVIGWPIAHSKSPLIHRSWLHALGIDGDYSRFPVHPDHLPAALKALPALGLSGVNVTVPHKVAVIPLLTRISPAATRIGAVNTIVCEADHSLTGHNTDAAGFLAPLAGQSFESATIIGAGGAARAVIAALQDHGVTSITLVNRSLPAAAALATHFGLAPPIAYLPGMTLPAASLTINSSSLGMVGQPPLEAHLAPTPTTVYDLVYAPLETPLLAAARAAGHPTIDGLEMLIGQAAIAFAHFYGATPPRNQDAALRSLLLKPATP